MGNCCCPNADYNLKSSFDFKTNNSNFEQNIKEEKNVNEKECELNNRKSNINISQQDINQGKKNKDYKEKTSKNQIDNSLNQNNFQYYNYNPNINKNNSKKEQGNNKKFEFEDLDKNIIDKINSNSSYNKSYMKENKITKIKKKEESKEFYDMVLDFSNFEQLRQDGWKILWPENIAQDKGFDKYNRCKENKNVVVGILGNKNRGKTFLLGRIIGKTNYTDRKSVV